MTRMLPLFVAVIVAAGAMGDLPRRDTGLLELAASAKGGAAAVNGRAAKGSSVSGKAKANGSVNGGKR